MCRSSLKVQENWIENYIMFLKIFFLQVLNIVREKIAEFPVYVDLRKTFDCVSPEISQESGE